MRQTQSIREEDINLIQTEIAKSDNIFSYSKDELIALLNKKTALVLYDIEKLIGLSAYKEINKDWVEIALLLVVSQYRNRGYGKELYKNLLQFLRGRNMYCCSRNPVVQNWLQSDDFKEVPFYRLPKEIIMYSFRTKIKLHKLKDLIKKGSMGGWKYYLRSKN